MAGMDKYAMHWACACLMLMLSSAAEVPDDLCNKDPVGTCNLFGCSSADGPTDCVNGECNCKDGHCALEGVCVPQSCPADTGGTCKWLECNDDRGPTDCTSDYKCVCKDGFCADTVSGYCKLKCEVDIGRSCKHQDHAHCSNKVDGSYCDEDGRCLCLPGTCLEHDVLSGFKECKAMGNAEELFVVKAGRTDMGALLAQARASTGSKAWNFATIGALAGAALVALGVAAVVSLARGRDAALTQTLLSDSEAKDATSCQKNKAGDFIQ